MRSGAGRCGSVPRRDVDGYWSITTDRDSATPDATGEAMAESRTATLPTTVRPQKRATRTQVEALDDPPLQGNDQRRGSPMIARSLTPARIRAGRRLASKPELAEGVETPAWRRAERAS